MELQRDLYRQFACEHASLPLFSQPFWLDVVCGQQGWGAAVASKGNKAIGGWPYYLSKKYGLQTVSMPPLTPSMGPCLNYPSGQKQATRLTFEHEVYGELQANLPKVSHFTQYLHHSIANVLPCLWSGYQCAPRYTYVLRDISDVDQTFANFKSNIKTDIRKASKQVEVEQSDDIDQFYEVMCKTYRRQERSSPLSRELVTRLDQACVALGCRRILLAKDEGGKVHSGAYLVWDNQEMYYLMGGSDPALRNSGAGSLVLWEAIQEAAQKQRHFNFEGSMLPAVEPFFRAFGGTQVPYYHLWRTPNPVLRTLRALMRG